VRINKGYLVKKTFTDGHFEGVIFSRKRDALDALSGNCGSGATLAVEWCDMYGGDDNIDMTEIELEQENSSE